MMKTRMFVCSLMAASTLAIKLGTALDIATYTRVPAEAAIDTEALVDTEAAIEMVAPVDTQASPIRAEEPAEAFNDDTDRGSKRSKPHMEANVKDNCCVFY